MAKHAMPIATAFYLCALWAQIIGLTCDQGGDVLSSCMTYNTLNSRQTALGETQRLLMGAVNQMLAELEWSSVTVIFNDQTEIFVRSLSEAVEMSRITECRLLHVPDILHGNTSRHIRSKLIEFYLEDESHYKNFLVICGRDCTVAIMESANSVDDFSTRRTYMRHHSRWLLLMSVNATTAVAKAASRLDHVTCISVPFDLNPVKGTNISQTTSLRDEVLPLESLLWLPGRRNWSCVGHVSRDKFVGEVFPNIPLGFNQREFIITTMPWPGFVFKSVSGTKTTYSGFCMDLLKSISERLNFTYRLVEPADANYGRVRNGRWTGLVGQLVRREVDFSVAGLSFTVGREAVIDYVSTPLNYDYKDVVYRKVGSDEGKWRLLLDVYQPVVLGVGLATYLIVSLMLFSFLSAPFFGNMTNMTTRTLLLESFWYMFGALFHKGGSNLPASLSARILVAAWWLFTIILASVYSANLIAVFAVPKTAKPFTSLKELLQNKDYKWGLIGGGSTEQFISSSTDPDIQTFWQNIVKFNETDSSVLIGDTYVHFEKVLKGRYAVLYGHERLSKEVACNIEYLGEKLTVYSKGLALPEGSPLKEDLDEIMLNLQENGILRMLDKKWLLNDWQCEGDARANVTVTLTDIQSIFYVLFIGLGGALLSLVLECLARRARMILCSKTLNSKSNIEI